MSGRTADSWWLFFASLRPLMGIPWEGEWHCSSDMKKQGMDCTGGRIASLPSRILCKGGWLSQNMSSNSQGWLDSRMSQLTFMQVMDGKLSPLIHCHPAAWYKLEWSGNFSHHILSFYFWCCRDHTSHSKSSSSEIIASLFHFMVTPKKPRRLTTTTVPTLHQWHLFVINCSTHNIFSLDPTTLSLTTYYWYITVLSRLVYRWIKCLRRPVKEGRCVAPDTLRNYCETHDFLGPCCLCPLLEMQRGIEHGWFVEAAIHVPVCGLYTGEYIAECAKSQWGYSGSVISSDWEKHLMLYLSSAIGEML